MNTWIEIEFDIHCLNLQIEETMNIWIEMEFDIHGLQKIKIETN